jgi:hypothetical protein
MRRYRPTNGPSRLPPGPPVLDGPPKISATDIVVADTIANWTASDDTVALQIIMINGVSTDAADLGYWPPLDIPASQPPVFGAWSRPD